MGRRALALMIGAALLATYPDTVALFTNSEVLGVHALSTGNRKVLREVLREGDRVLWAAEGSTGDRYAAAFNLGDQPKPVTLDAANVGLLRVLDGSVTELWTGRAVRTAPITAQSDAARGVAPGSTALFFTLEPHGAASRFPAASWPGGQSSTGHRPRG